MSSAKNAARMSGKERRVAFVIDEATRRNGCRDTIESNRVSFCCVITIVLAIFQDTSVTTLQGVERTLELKPQSFTGKRAGHHGGVDMHSSEKVKDTNFFVILRGSAKLLSVHDKSL